MSGSRFCNMFPVVDVLTPPTTVESPVKLNYFPLMAKGFGVSLVLEDSGIQWEPNDFGGAGLKTLKEAFPVWGQKKAETTPFYQLPVLYVDGLEVGQVRPRPGEMLYCRHSSRSISH